MGNICGKAEGDNFSQPGRVLGAPPPAPKTAPVPRKVGGPPRTLGGASTDSTPASGETGPGGDAARRKAAEAAEVCSALAKVRQLEADDRRATGSRESGI